MLRAIKNTVVSSDVKYRRVLTGLCRGCYLPLDLQNQFIQYLGLYEREIHNAVRSCVNQGDCCYDLGTAHGYYALALGKLAGSSGKVLAFEANDNLNAQLPETIRRNASIVRADITPMNYYVGASTDPSKKQINIDHVVYELGFCAPGMMKIDVEGGEYDVLLGAQRTIAEHQPNMVVEVHSSDLEEKCIDYLERNGYQIQIINQAKHLFWVEKRPTEHNRWILAVQI